MPGSGDAGAGCCRHFHRRAAGGRRCLRPVAEFALAGSWCALRVYLAGQCRTRDAFWTQVPAMTDGTRLTATHWGNFQVRVTPGGGIEVSPAAGDLQPSPIGRSLAAWQDPA